MPDSLSTILQPYIIRFKRHFAEQEMNNKMNGKSGLEVREYLTAKMQDCFSEEKIDRLMRDDLIEIYTYSPALLGYAQGSRNKTREEICEFIDSIGADEFREKIKYLLYGGGDLVERYAGVISSTRSLNHAVVSEILSYFSPSEYACLNWSAEKAITFLGLDTTTAPKTGNRCGEYYLQFTTIARDILTEIRKDSDSILHSADYIVLDNFLYCVKWAYKWQMVNGKKTRFYLDNPAGKNIICAGSREIADQIGEKILTISDQDDVHREIYSLYKKMGETDPDILEIDSFLVDYIVNFMEIGDLIFATQGNDIILAVGVVKSDVKMDRILECPLYREVFWIYPEINQPIPPKIKDRLSDRHSPNDPLDWIREREALGIYGLLKNTPPAFQTLDHQYWILLPSSRTQETYAPLKHWDEWQEKGIIGIPWEMLAKKYGDTLFEFSDPDVFREKFREAVEGDPFEKPVNAYMPYDFLFTMQEGDTVVIPRGRQGILGQATVVSGPKIDLALDFSIYREVRWEVFEKEIPVPYDLRGIVVSKRLKKITKDDYEALFHQETETMDTPAFRKITRLLAAKNQVILYGPPGTGKTYTAQTYIAAHPAAAHAFVTFHPSFAYEDFIEGLRPRTDAEGRICYEIEDGIFKTLCKDAFNALMERAGIENRWEEGEDVPALSPREEAEALAVRDRVPIFLVIDEINRGDIPRIFGELITLLEKDKRLCTENALVVTLPYSKTRFGIPPNLFVIGTMNTADRSIALLDIALHRRFGFIEVMPDYAVLEETLTSDDPAVQEVFTIAVNALRDVNTRIIKNYDRNHQIGHSYLMKLAGCTTRDEAVESLQTTWECEVIPLLQEYFYDSPQKFRECVGSDTAMPDDGEEFVRALSENRA